MKKQNPFGKELQYTSVTSCIIQLQPTQVGRKGLVCVILSPPLTQTLFKTCTTRILHYSNHPAHTLLLQLCSAQPSQTLWQPSAQSTTYFKASIPYPHIFLLFPFLLLKGRQAAILLWFYLKSPEWTQQRTGTKIQGQIFVDHWENSMDSREQYLCPWTSPQYYREGFFQQQRSSPRKCSTGMAVQLEGVHMYRTKDLSCTVPCITATHTTGSIQMCTTDLVQGNHWYLSVMDPFFTSC